ncbi:MAG: MCE family protein [Rhodococcus sp. (in: high G+C Gram-positive bacteria)]|uniref:MCE family protein n=1 Tax=Rhodococcus sp. TaxID=1831 RepID=UPI003BB0BE40
MRRFRDLDPVPLGIIGTAVVAVVVAVSLQWNSLPFIDSATEYRAEFTETAGLREGDRVMVAGVRVGEVRALDLVGPVVVVTFSLDREIRLGDATTVDISTATVLGAKALEIDPGGNGALGEGAVIGLGHTTSPYQLTDVLGDLTRTAEDIDTDQLAASLATLSGTLQNTPDDLRAALDGVSRLSHSVASRDRSLRALLDSAASVTDVLAQRSGQVNTLIVDAGELLRELVERRTMIGELAGHVAGLSEQVSGLVQDNRDRLGPTLATLDSVLGVLNANSDSLQQAIERMAPYVTQLGEAVASGPFFNSYIQNLIPGDLLRPFVDAALAPYTMGAPR